MSTAEEFLDAAQTLVDHGTHSGHQRRAISTAYYAAFHSLIDTFAPIVFQDPVTQDECRQWFNHGDMRAVASTIGSLPPPARTVSDSETEHRAFAAWLKNANSYGFTAAPTPEVVEICRLFKELQERRHEADYFGDGGVSKTNEAENACTAARRICELVATCVETNDSDFRRLGAQMLRSSLKPPRR